MKVLIVGGGISGCALALTLHSRGIDFVWVDAADAGAPSRVAAGIITPIVPKRFALTWQHDVVLPIAHTFYEQACELTEARFYTTRTNILVAESTAQMNDWLMKSDSTLFARYIHSVHKPNSLNLLHTPYGAIEIAQAAVIDTPSFINNTHRYFKDKLFYTTPLNLDTDSLTQLNARWGADKAVLCTGWYAHNADIRAMPFNPAKGETITIQTEEGVGALHTIVQRHVYIAPVNDTTLKVGATYEWNNLDNEITNEARAHLLKETTSVLNIPFKVTGHSAAVRPATHARRPIAGAYPGVDNVYVLNGMGTKGLLLAPWCAQLLTNYILNNAPLHPEINIALQRKR